MVNLIEGGKSGGSNLCKEIIVPVSLNERKTT